MKDKTASSRSEKQSPVLRGVLPVLCVVLAVFAFAVQPPAELFRGFWKILISDAGLITDPAVTGGAGAALFERCFGAGAEHGAGLWDASSCDGPDVRVSFYDGGF